MLPSDLACLRSTAKAAIGLKDPERRKLVSDKVMENMIAKLDDPSLSDDDRRVIVETILQLDNNQKSNCTTRIEE